MSYLSIGLLACLLTLTLLPLLAVRAGRAESARGGRRGAARPPVSRRGGLALLTGLLVTGGLAATRPIGAHGDSAAALLPILGGGALIALVGAVDDRRALSPWLKLAGQMVAALVAVSLGLRVGFLPEGALNGALTVFCLVGGANAVNLIDGVDGLAGTLAFLVAATLFFLGRDAENVAAACLAAALAGGALAFLWFNLPPARIYLGDAGSNLLGFGLAAVALLLSHGGHGMGHFAGGLLMLAVPIVETATTIGRRVLSHRSPLRGDRDHIHHRLLRRGWSIGQLLLLHGGVTVLLAAFVLSGQAVAVNAPLRSAVALGLLVTGASIYLAATRRPASARS